MPITPLHAGILAPVNHWFPGKVSVLAFIIANLLADLPVVLHLYSSKVSDMGGSVTLGTLHDTFTHTFLGALVVGLVLSLFRFKNKAWWLGSMLGTVSHVALDMFVHSDVYPFAPFSNWNPFYFDSAHAMVSVVLMLGLAYWLLQVNDQQKAARLKKQNH